MKIDKQYRINGFDQIKAFYSYVFNNADKRITPQHISLYLFLINQANRNNWVEWFKCPYDLAMAGACIGNKKTYYSCLSDLASWGLIFYEKGINEWKSPLIKLEVLKSTTTDTSTVPLSEPLSTTLLLPLPTNLPTHIYKLLTNNLKLITDNLPEIIDFLEGLGKEVKTGNKSIKEILLSDLSESDDHYTKIAYSFWLLFKDKLSEYKINSTDLSKAKAKNWINPIRLMLEVDKRTDDELREIFHFLKAEKPGNSGFAWSKNIRSTESLRKQFEKVLTEARVLQKIEQNGNKRINGNKGATPEQLAELMANKLGISTQAGG
jgi:hypothetical protein